MGDVCVEKFPPKPPRCFACARPMQLVRRTSRFSGLPDRYAFECRACGELHIEEGDVVIGRPDFGATPAVSPGITRDPDIIGAYYHYIQNSFVLGVNCSPSAAAGNSRCAGWFDGFSAVLDWRFLPKWDAYIGTFLHGSVWRLRQRRYFPQQPCHHRGAASVPSKGR